jgi:predicted transposase YdaD
LSIQAIQLIEIDEAGLPNHLARIKANVAAQPEILRVDWLDLLETILVYKLPHITRDEVRAMLADILNVELKQTRFYQDVFAEGRVEGRAEGRVEGEQAILRRQLVKRFGPLPAWAEQRLNAASSAQLELWSERLLDAASLETVFDGA